MGRTEVPRRGQSDTAGWGNGVLHSWINKVSISPARQRKPRVLYTSVVSEDLEVLPLPFYVLSGTVIPIFNLQR